MHENVKIDMLILCICTVSNVSLTLSPQNICLLTVMNGLPINLLPMKRERDREKDEELQIKTIQCKHAHLLMTVT